MTEVGRFIEMVTGAFVAVVVAMFTIAAGLGVFAYVSGTECKSIGAGDWFKVETCIRR
jgi:hypothetical protein